MAGDWLDNAEVLVLQPLEDSPQPLWALRWHEETTLLALADPYARTDLVGGARPGRSTPLPLLAGTLGRG